MLNDMPSAPRSVTILCWLALLWAAPTWAEDESPADPPAESTPDIEKQAEWLSALRPRLLGPALMSGRIGDFAVHPRNHDLYYAAACSGGVWKTTNGGHTWSPVFDSQGSYSIGCLALDPNNPRIIWVGTGENNSQRSVSFGDGVYRSLDGGQTWENLGLAASEHIGKILIDPHDGQTVYVAAQGPLWNSGGDRGLYKSTDGGRTWERSLHISDDTGINEVHADPRDFRVLYASAYQRRRHVWTLINGGPESAIYKSTDAGATWRKLTQGLPSEEMGRIGLAISPVDPDVVYAIIEAAQGKGGFFRSRDGGETWQKQSGYVASSPQYYHEIVCDPAEVDRVYSLDTFLQVTDDGGRTFRRVGQSDRHVDDHALWINPQNNRHLRVGGDGGIYETRDAGANWWFCENLPVTQFYRISTDNSSPFYYVYGGTQDNNSQGAPSRTRDRAGITNADWFITVGGDGYETQVDPEDPNVVYSMWQYGGLVRFDRRSGETIDIKPREQPGEEPYRWNWDSPLIISPHAPQRLYFAANRLFRSDDRGDSWTAISGDLTRQLDRNTLPVMGRIQGADAVAKGDSTSFFGNCVSLSESPLVEGLIYVGTDDGLIQVSEDGGQNWRKIAVFPRVPDMTYVSCVTASRHDADTVYASFDNHKNGDFRPYLLRSQDRGQNWEAVSGNLPERDLVYCLQEDHVDAQLLFAGTEFGASFSLDGGSHWQKIKGLPTIAVRDIELQRRENDLVLGTFGRSIYILDDYSPLRSAHRELLVKDAAVFPVKQALCYIQSNRLGGASGRGSQGATFFAAPNPPFGATFTYFLKDKLTTRREQRQQAEKEATQQGKSPPYPTLDQLRTEDEEREPEVMLEVRDAANEVVRRLRGQREAGLHRLAWDLRYPSLQPVRLGAADDLPPWMQPASGHLALPGNYTVTLLKIADGKATPLTDPVPFEVVPLGLATFAAEDQAGVREFRAQVAELDRAVRGAIRAGDELRQILAHARQAIQESPQADLELLAEVARLDELLAAFHRRISGDRTRQRRNEPALPSIADRVQNVIYSQWEATSPPTQTEKQAYQHAGQAFSETLADLQTLAEQVRQLNERLEQAKTPWTPGRIPVWQMQDTP